MRGLNLRICDVVMVVKAVMVNPEYLGYERNFFINWCIG